MKTRHRTAKAVGIGALAAALITTAGLTVSAMAGPPQQAAPATASAAAPAAAPEASPRAAEIKAAKAAAADTSVLIGPNHTWNYFFGTGYDRGSLGSNFRHEPNEYSLGAQPIGFGSTYNKTELVAQPGTAPVTAYFKTAVRIADLYAWKALRITVIADDGVAVYMNSRELTRVNLPSGELTDSTWATAAPSTTVARSKPTVVEIPSWQLASDDSWYYISAEVHKNYRGTRDLSFQLTAELVPNPDRTVIARGSEWNYRYTTEAPPANWTYRCGLNPEDPYQKNKRPAPFGFGSPIVATDLDVQPTSKRPLTAYFCLSRGYSYDWGKEPFGDLEITTWANDGMVIYVDGKEVKRVNMPQGTITHTTYATSAPWTALAMRNPVTVTVPNSQLEDGGVTIAVEVHLNWKGTTDMTFDLTARSTGVE